MLGNFELAVVDRFESAPIVPHESGYIAAIEFRHLDISRPNR